MRTLGVAGALLAGAVLTVVAPHAWAATDSLRPRPPAPQPVRTPPEFFFPLPADAPTPGAGFKKQAVYRVTTGVQIYTCNAAADDPAKGVWSTSSTPEAILANYGGPFFTIHHFGGPRWQSNTDRSTVIGTVANKVTKTGTIPWLLLTTKLETAPGPTGRPKEMDRVTHITRVNTSGGVAPTRACTPGETQRVQYKADYVFWIPSGAPAADPAASASAPAPSAAPTSASPTP